MIVDQYGVMGQLQDDGSVEGGDAVNWTGHLIYFSDVQPTWNRDYDQLRFFNCSFGAFVRHPDAANTYNGFGAYYRNPWDGVISRDQLTGIIGGVIRSKDAGLLLKMILHHMCWLMLFAYNTRINGQNPEKSRWKWPDLTLFDIWSMYLRGFGVISLLFYPILMILDLHLLINTILVNKSEEDDKISYAMKLCVSVEFTPTIVSLIAREIVDGDKLLGSIKRYWSGWRQQPEMPQYYEATFKRLKII